MVVVAGLLVGLFRLPGLVYRWRLELVLAVVALIVHAVAMGVVGDPVLAWFAVGVLAAGWIWGLPALDDRARAVRTAGLAPVHIRRVTRSSTGWELGVVYTAGQIVGSRESVAPITLTPE